MQTPRLIQFLRGLQTLAPQGESPGPRWVTSTQLCQYREAGSSVFDYRSVEGNLCPRTRAPLPKGARWERGAAWGQAEMPSGSPACLHLPGALPCGSPGPGFAGREMRASRARRGLSSCQTGGLSICRVPRAQPGLCSPSPRAPRAAPRQQRVPKSAGAAVPPVGCFHDRFPYFINRDCTECKLV